MEFPQREAFAEYLRDKQRIQPQAVPWMVKWVEEFLEGLDSPAHWEERCNAYYRQLESRVAPWRYTQAAKSVQLYRAFLSTDASGPPRPQPGSWIDVKEAYRGELRRQGRSLQTEKTYLNWITRFANRFSDSHPESLETQHVKEFLTWLAVERRVSSATQNQAFNALLFLYRYVLLKPINELSSIPRSRPTRRLPVVLSIDQISSIIRLMRSPYRLMAALMYGSGIRLNECLSLRHKDLNLETRVLTASRLI